MQLKMFMDKPELRPKPNINQYNGVNVQTQIAKKIPNLIGEEMGNFLTVDNIRIYFSNDIITPNGVVEVKSVNNDKPIEDWYINNSILQCAVYKSFIINCGYNLKTSKFHIANGNKNVEYTLPDSFEYILYFGGRIFKINVNNPNKIVKFFIEKAKHCLNWNDAKSFDEKYKRKEFEVLKDCFSVIEC
jgi:hypothetical protein